MSGRGGYNTGTVGSGRSYLARLCVLKDRYIRRMKAKMMGRANTIRRMLTQSDKRGG